MFFWVESVPHSRTSLGFGVSGVAIVGSIATKVHGAICTFVAMDPIFRSKPRSKRGSARSCSWLRPNLDTILQCRWR